MADVFANLTSGWVRRVIDRAFQLGSFVPRFGGLALGWDDLRAPLTGQQLTISAGRLDYDFTECTVDFSATARYPEEPIAMTFQMQHDKLLDSVIVPHLHWVQSENNIPNWLIAARWYKNGAAIPAFTLAKYDSHVYTYSSGSIMQLTNFPALAAPSDETLSSICDIILYRDSANVSTLFAGADPYTVPAKAKEFDIHFQRDSLGSITASTKESV